MRLMLKVQKYYTKSKIRKRKNHPNKLYKDELRQYKREKMTKTNNRKEQDNNLDSRESSVNTIGFEEPYLRRREN